VLKVATCRPLDVQPMDDLATMMGCEVEPVLAARSEIASLINRAYRHKADGVDEALQDVKDTDIVSIAENIQESEDLLDANKAPVIKLVNMLLFQALKLRASDIHLQPYPDRFQVRMRIDGVLYDMESIPKRAQEAIVSRVKVMGKMDIAERRLPQDARATIIKLVNTILFQALKLRASDVHFQSYPDRMQVRFRIDGILYDMDPIPRKAQDAIISRVKVMGKMDIAERRLPQDGRATIRIGDGEVDVRISSVPTTHGERIVMRLLDKTARLYQLDEIGLTPENVSTLREFLNYTHGIILVTGPTGSGKTTTLYAAMNEIDTSQKNVLTIEDPVEYSLPGISQVQVNTKKGLTFATGLRSFLRQDPDVMMVGEIRDLETAEVAIRAALTGHLVFSTVHTNDAASTITRMVDQGVEPYLVASSLIMVIAQRLVRTICPHCKTTAPITDEWLAKLKKMDVKPEQLDGQIAYGQGCDECFHSGYSGRTAIYEFMPVDETLRTQIMEGTTATQMKRSAIERGMITLRMDGQDKILQRLTTPDEVLRVTQLDMG
jgi:general secretion pathway protein E